MGKALVIKNADFSANAVTTITFNDVPCTGVAFSSSTVSVSALGTVSLEYTLTPSNTTDTLIWASSDTSVVSITDGVLTAVGIGTATITLTCGSYSATCTVTVAITESPVYFVGAGYTVTVDSDEAIYLGASTARLACAGDPADGNFSVTIPIYETTYYAPESVAAIKIPQNAGSVHVEATGVYGGGEYIYFVEGDTELTDSNSHTCVKLISSVALTATYVSGARVIDEDVTIPDGATGFIVTLRASSSSGLEAITTEAEMIAYAEETMQVAISYVA